MLVDFVRHGVIETRAARIERVMQLLTGRTGRRDLAAHLLEQARTYGRTWPERPLVELQHPQSYGARRVLPARPSPRAIEPRVDPFPSFC